MKRQYSKLLVMAMTMAPLFAWAERGGGGTDIGRGGNVVVLPDQSVHLADPYIIRPAVEAVHPYTDFHPSIRAEIDKIGRLMVRLGAAVDEKVETKSLKRNPNEDEKKQARIARYASRDAQAKFIAMNVANVTTEYVFVDQFPSTCQPVGDLGPVPEGYRVLEVGCTQGPTTYILKDVFSRLSVREMALSIIHERMHGLIRNFEHHFITDVTQGLGILLDLLNQQKAGKRPVLNDSQIKFLKGTLKAFAVTGLTEDSPGDEAEFWQSWEIASGGGIFHQDTQIDPKAYLGAGAMLGAGGVMGPGSEMLNSTCYLVSCELREGASLADTVVAPKVSTKEFEFDSRLFSAVIGKNSLISGSSSLMPSLNSNTAQRIVIGDNVTMDNVDLSGFSALKIDAGASLKNVGIVFTPMNHFMLKFEMAESSSIQNIRTPVLAGDLNATSDTEFMISVSTNRRLDFKSSPVCEDSKQWVLLKRSLLVDKEDSLRGQCRTGF